MSSTRTVMIGAKRVIINNVPDNISDAQLEVYARMKIYQIGMIRGLGAS